MMMVKVKHSPNVESFSFFWFSLHFPESNGLDNRSSFYFLLLHFSVIFEMEFGHERKKTWNDYCSIWNSISNMKYMRIRQTKTLNKWKYSKNERGENEKFLYWNSNFFSHYSIIVWRKLFKLTMDEDEWINGNGNGIHFHYGKFFVLPD